MVGPDGLTDFGALRRRGAGEVAVLYAFDLIELDGSDLRNCRSKPASDASLAPAQAGRVAAERAHRRGRPAGVRPRLPTRCGGHRLEAARLLLPLRAVPRVDQVQESGIRRRATRPRGRVDLVMRIGKFGSPPIASAFLADRAKT